jgi:hypothetical protein
MTLGARSLLTGAGRRERVPRRARETEAIRSAVALEGESGSSDAVRAFAFDGDHPKEEPRVRD